MNMEERNLRIAVIDAAHVHARTYMSLLEARPDVDVALVDASGYGDIDASVVVDSEEAIWQAWNGAGPDAVVVTTENNRHDQVVREAARRGVHVLCEKPLATSLDAAQEMVAACEDAGVVLMTAFPVHFSPQIAQLRSVIATSAIGSVLAVLGTNNGKLPAGRDWFTDPNAAGGGALMDHVVHVAQILDSIFGEPTEVHAVSNSILHSDVREREVETGALVTLRYSTGMIATIDCSWSQPAEATTWGGLTIEAVGTAGRIAVDPFAHRIEGPGQWHPYGMDLDAALIDAFISAVHSGVPAEPSGHVGLRTLRVVTAAQESVRLGQPVPLPRPAHPAPRRETTG